MLLIYRVTVLCFGSTRICLHVFDIQNLFFLDFPKRILSVESFKHSSSDICSSLWLMSDVWLSCGAEKWFDDTGTTYILLFRSSFFRLILLRTWKCINIRTKTIKNHSEFPDQRKFNQLWACSILVSPHFTMATGKYRAEPSKRFIGSALIIYKLHLNQNVKIDFKSNYPAIISWTLQFT